ncbi:MAG: hypothetical protein GWO20_08260 [Candidatus Korarchaeota archaeon]|nr:hypothetical protein [Candidatus Korarchaeota archaeon]NIU83472.1 hypothetical protein [Candidatus Thorarchaeota archaeon]
MADKPSITPRTRLICAKSFKCNGRVFNIGDPFKHRKMEILWQRVRTLYDQGFITIEGQSKRSRGDSSAKRNTEGNSVEVIHKGGGWYDVLVGGVVQNYESMRQEEARELKEELLKEV